MALPLRRAARACYAWPRVRDHRRPRGVMACGCTLGVVVCVHVRGARCAGHDGIACTHGSMQARRGSLWLAISCGRATALGPVISLGLRRHTHGGLTLVVRHGPLARGLLHPRRGPLARGLRLRLLLRSGVCCAAVCGYACAGTRGMLCAGARGKAVCRSAACNRSRPTRSRLTRFRRCGTFPPLLRRSHPAVPPAMLAPPHPATPPALPLHCSGPPPLLCCATVTAAAPPLLLLRHRRCCHATRAAAAPPPLLLCHSRCCCATVTPALPSLLPHHRRCGRTTVPAGTPPTPQPHHRRCGRATVVAAA